MYRPGGMSSDEDSDWDDDYYSHSTPLSKEKVNNVVPVLETCLENQLHDAVLARDADRVRDLIAKGADVNSSPNNHWNSIIQASSLGCLDIVELLIQNGADVNCSHEKFTPLLALCSCSSRNEEELLRCFDVLVSNGCEINVSDWYQVSALSHAVRQRHEMLVLRLIEEGANIDSKDQDGWSPLFFAVDSGNANIVSLLINSGADIYGTERSGRSLLDIALEKEYSDIVKLLNGGVESDKWIVSWNESLEPNLYKRLLLSLPDPKDRFSGFRQDVYNILNAVQLTHLNTFFYEKGIGLGHLLTADESTLKDIGIKFWFERRKILRTVEKFHEHPWDIKSFGVVSTQRNLDVVQIAQIMATITRQLYIISVSTYWWGKQGGIDPQNKTMPDNLRETLKTLRIIREKVKNLQNIFRKIDKEDPIIPSDLILPPPHSSPCKTVFKICLPLIILGIFFVGKKKVLPSIINYT